MAIPLNASSRQSSAEQDIGFWLSFTMCVLQCSQGMMQKYMLTSPLSTVPYAYQAVLASYPVTS